MAVDEARANLNLADFGCEVDGNIDMRCYKDRFDRLDVNGDGMVSAAEANSAADERNCFNLTRADIKAGLALASQWFPEDASAWVANEALLVDLTYRNVIPSEDTPRPQDPLAGMPLPRSLRPPVEETAANISTAMVTKDCADARITIFTTVLELFCQILGFNLKPSQNLVDVLLRGTSEFAEAVRGIFAYMDLMPSPMDIATSAWGLFMALYEEGFVLQAFWDVVRSMSWWRRAVTLIRIAATVLLWIASAGVAQILQIAMMAVSIADLTTAFRQEREVCSDSPSTTQLV